MNGPRILCAGCGEPTRGINAICDKCMTPPGESGPPVDRCTLCERGYKRDKWGQHTNKHGGYVGKCQLTYAVSADSIENQ